MGFGNLGLSELLVLAVLVLVFFGPRRLPEIARSLGGALREFHRGWNEIRRQLEDLEGDVTGEDGRRRQGASRRPPPRRVEPTAWDDGYSEHPEEEPAEEPGERRPEGGDETVPEEGAERPDADRRGDEDAEPAEPGEGGRDPGEGRR